MHACIVVCSVTCSVTGIRYSVSRVRLTRVRFISDVESGTEKCDRQCDRYSVR